MSIPVVAAGEQKVSLGRWILAVGMAKSIRACVIWEDPAVWLWEQAGRDDARVQGEVWEAGSDHPGVPRAAGFFGCFITLPTM